MVGFFGATFIFQEGRFMNEEARHETVVVPLRSYVRAINTVFKRKQKNAEKLKGKRRIVVPLYPCPVELYHHLAQFCNIETPSGAPPSKLPIRDPHLLDTLFGRDWENHSFLFLFVLVPACIHCCNHKNNWQPLFDSKLRSNLFVCLSPESNIRECFFFFFFHGVKNRIAEL